MPPALRLTIRACNDNVLCVSVGSAVEPDAKLARSGRRICRDVILEVVFVESFGYPIDLLEARIREFEHRPRSIEDIDVFEVAVERACDWIAG